MTAIAKEAAKYGMKVILDLRYSNPGKQIVPKAWQNLNPTDIQTEIFQYTRKIMNDFKNAGIDVGMVQTGNEITNGMLELTVIMAAHTKVHGLIQLKHLTFATT